MSAPEVSNLRTVDWHRHQAPCPRKMQTVGMRESNCQELQHLVVVHTLGPETMLYTALYSQTGFRLHPLQLACKRCLHQ